MTAFEVGAFVGIAGGAVAGGILCKSHGLLAAIAGVIGGGVAGLFVGLLYGFLVVVLCGLWYFVRGRLRPDGTIRGKADDKDGAA